MRPPPTTCALCGSRDATTLTEWDGRGVPACDRCLADDLADAEWYDIADASWAAKAVHLARRHPGLTALEIAEMLGVAGDQHRRGPDARAHDAVATGLSRAVKDGYLVRVDESIHHCGGCYYPTEKPWNPMEIRHRRGKRAAATRWGRKRRSA